MLLSLASMGLAVLVAAVGVLAWSLTVDADEERLNVLASGARCVSLSSAVLSQRRRAWRCAWTRAHALLVSFHDMAAVAVVAVVAVVASRREGRRPLGEGGEWGALANREQEGRGQRGGRVERVTQAGVDRGWVADCRRGNRGGNEGGASGAAERVGSRE